MGAVFSPMWSRVPGQGILPWSTASTMWRGSSVVALAQALTAVGLVAAAVLMAATDLVAAVVLVAVVACRAFHA